MRQHRFYKDSYGYLLETSRSWGIDDGRGDAVARTVLAAIVYRDDLDFRFVVPQESFPGFLSGADWCPKRHPEDPRTEDFSRDHTVWFVILLRYFFKMDLHHALRIPYRISKKHKQGFHVWLWIRALAKDRWWDNFIHWLLCEVWLFVVRIWDGWLIRRAGITSVHYKDFKKTQDSELSDRERFARNNLMMPGYTLDTLAFMVHCLSDGRFKDRLKKRVIPLVERSNWLIRKLMGDDFTAEEKWEIENYTGMTPTRWNKWLNQLNPWDLYPLEGEQPPYNLDVDILHANLEWK